VLLISDEPQPSFSLPSYPSDPFSLFLSWGRINLFYAAGPSDAKRANILYTSRRFKDGIQKQPSTDDQNALGRTTQALPVRPGIFLQKTDLRYHLSQICLQALRAVPERFAHRYGRPIPQVEKGLFDDIAGEWFSSGPDKNSHGRYILIDDLKEMLVAMGLSAFYEKHKKKLPINVNDE